MSKLEKRLERLEQSHEFSGPNIKQIVLKGITPDGSDGRTAVIDLGDMPDRSSARRGAGDG